MSPKERFLGKFCADQHHLEQTFCHCEPVFGEAISVLGEGDCFGAKTAPRNDVFKMWLTRTFMAKFAIRKGKIGFT